MPDSPTDAAQKATTSPGPEPESPGQKPTTPVAGSDSEPESFDRAYVENLRREAAGYRTRAQQAEEARRIDADTHSKERERIEAERDALNTRVADMAVEQAVFLEATRLGFYDPEDAVRLVRPSDLKMDDSGKVAGVGEALQALATKKPHLLRGRAVGDATSGAPDGVRDMNRAIRSMAGRH